MFFFQYNDPVASQRIKHFLKYVLIDILLAALISFFLINYVISAYKISGDSMNPILENDERILISKIPVRRGHIRRFDIVVFYRPDEPEKTLIKRVIGMPEEIIEIRKGQVSINYQPLQQPFLPAGENWPAAASGQELKPLLIPKGHYFLMGDNRDVSRDSRLFGPVPQKYIIGKGVFRYWPFARSGSI